MTTLHLVFSRAMDFGASQTAPVCTSQQNTVRRVLRSLGARIAMPASPLVPINPVVMTVNSCEPPSPDSGVLQMSFQHVPGCGIHDLGIGHHFAPTATGVLVSDKANQTIFHLKCAKEHHDRVIGDLFAARAPNAEQIDFSYLTEKKAAATAAPAPVADQQALQPRK